MNDRLTKLDVRHYNVARREVRYWSKDPDKKVGALAASPDGRQVAWGYNGFPRGITDTRERLGDKELKNRLMVHAELNCLLNSTSSIRGWTLYVTEAPCHECCLAIIQAGVARVVSLAPSLYSRHFGSQTAGLALLEEAKVEWIEWPSEA